MSLDTGATTAAAVCYSSAMLHRPSALVVILCLTFSAADGQQTKIKERELVEVRSQIEGLRESIAEKSRRRTRLNKNLQKAEAELVAARARITDLQQSQRESTARLTKLAADIKGREAALDTESDQLVTQIRAAYTNGRTERVRLLFNQKNPADLGRMLSYYRYLSDWRQENISSIERQLAQLSALRADEVATRERLEQLAHDQNAELERKNGVQSERQDLLVSLNREIASEGGQIAKLRQQEADLERLIVELSSILSDYPITSEEPFASLKGGLTWPVAGRLIHDFGQPRAESSLRWNGVVLAADRGREVRSLYHGRVAFADWLPGLGLLTIVDHGEGYLSLYGHNDSLLKNVGDWVAAGDAIATVGDSGGQLEPALYLEIRNGKTPLNPRHWISKQPRRQ